MSERKTPAGGIPRLPSLRELREITPGRMPVHRDHSRPQTGNDRAPLFVDEDLTDRYEGEELAHMRAKRPTDKRLELLEAHKDDSNKRLTAVESAVVVFGAELKANTKITQHVADTLTTTQPIIMQLLGHRATLTQERDHIKETTTIKVGGEKQLDDIKKVASWRDWIGKALGLVGAAIALVTAAFAAGRC